jgi:hypothetical protein
MYIKQKTGFNESLYLYMFHRFHFFKIVYELDFNCSIDLFLSFKKDANKSPFVDKPKKFVYNFFVIRIKYN